MEKKFNCELCNYQTDIPYSYKRHCQSKKHLKNIENENNHKEEEKSKPKVKSQKKVKFQKDEKKEPKEKKVVRRKKKKQEEDDCHDKNDVLKPKENEKFVRDMYDYVKRGAFDKCLLDYIIRNYKTGKEILSVYSLNLHDQSFIYAKSGPVEGKANWVEDSNGLEVAGLIIEPIINYAMKQVDGMHERLAKRFESGEMITEKDTEKLKIIVELKDYIKRNRKRVVSNVIRGMVPEFLIDTNVNIPDDYTGESDDDYY